MAMPGDGGRGGSNPKSDFPQKSARRRYLVAYNKHKSLVDKL